MGGNSNPANLAFQQVEAHYERLWGTNWSPQRFTRGPVEQLGPDFRILVFPPRPQRQMWTYATVGMSQVNACGESHGLELHLFAPSETEAHLELLTAIAHYHLTGTPLGWAHTVNFGRPWYPRSPCSFGLLSLPYLDWPDLQWQGEPQSSTQFLWLIPITESERSYKRAHGLESLEQRFETAGFDFIDPARKPVT